jgi:two-component system NtrC family sensor kinase
MRLALKLSAALIAGIILVLSVDAYFRVRRNIEVFEADMSRDNITMGRALSAAVSELWVTEGQPEALNLIRLIDERRPSVFIRWVLLDQPSCGKHNLLVTADILQKLKEGKELARVMEPEGGDERFLVTFVPVIVTNRIVGAIEIADSYSYQEKHIQNIIIRAVITTLISIMLCSALALLLGVFLVGHPVRELVRKARRVGRGDFSGRLEARQHDEIGMLAGEMNLMADRLAEAKDKIALETTAKIAAVEQLRHADRLTTVGKLASGIAHEMGTPLNVVSGRAKLIASGEAQGKEAVENARIILEQSEKITNIIRQLLDFARRRDPHKTTIDLRQIAAKTVALLEPIAQKNGVTLLLEEGPEPASLNADGSQIQQTLMNLVINGIQAMKKGGKLTIGFRRERARPPGEAGRQEASCLVMIVNDEGEGIPPENIQKIFDPFFTTKGIGEGTGLGLSVAYGIVREHGGWIDVESGADRGSRFDVYLPVEDHHG